MRGNRTCAFFGHRVVYEDITIELHEAIRKAIEEYGVTTFWCGGYGAFDEKAAGAVFRIKQRYPEIELLLIRAYLPKQRDQLPEIYDGSIYPEGLENVPKRFAISHRNQWMATNCDMVIAYIKHGYGGAFKAYSIARNKGKVLFTIGE